MTERVKVLFLPHPTIKSPWEQDLIEEVGGVHDLRFYDSCRPLAQQFDDVRVVIDFGGVMGTTEMTEVSSSVRLWQILGTGFENFDLARWKQMKIPVANCPGPFSAIPLAECALMFMLMLARRWHETQQSIGKGVLFHPLGVELANQRLLLIGFGASARELARRARVFGMRLSAIDVRAISPEEREEFALDFVSQPDSIDDVIGNFDFVSLHLPLNNETRAIINARRLSLMKRTANLINVARAALVDEVALHDALTHGRLAGAGLDVFTAEPLSPDDPMLKLSNVVATPHISGMTSGTSRRRAACARDNIDRTASGLDPLYQIG